MIDFVILSKMSLTAWEMLSHGALNCKMNDLGEQKQREGEHFGRKNEKLKNRRRRLSKLLRDLKELCGGTRRIKAQSLLRRKKKVLMVAEGARNRRAVQR